MFYRLLGLYAFFNTKNRNFRRGYVCNLFGAHRLGNFFTFLGYFK